MQNLCFYRAKQPLLERKTIGFVMRWYIMSYEIGALLKNNYRFIAFFSPIHEEILLYFIS
ncbi:hypothetical protein M573_101055 [Prevotella intermedia ZT]|uniref:Uncharacterized protein n=1 Tax=Prevotella intermedia ZT TaxID=1347790 RepID=A0AAP0V951_PREIN|nr:hypothetical protein M573_101055 [Prevotella intermedia ZT]